MTLLGIAQIVFFFVIVLAVTKLVGLFMCRVFEGERTFLHPMFRPLERVIYWLGGVREDEEQSWVRYSASMISFSIFSFLFAYLIQRLQGHLPLNPMHFSTGQAPSSATSMTPDLAFNTAVSFVTNTNWQSYSPDTTVSYFTQMAALAVQNFVSAAVGIAVAIALIRGFARHTTKTIGNFWVDMTRSCIYILLPICILATLLLVSQGTIQNFKQPVTVQTLEGAPQVIEQGPLASQEAIKMLEPTAADTLMPTPRIHTRIRRHLQTCSRCS
jgi:potassium-transporting ATPase potassium-binding subunit